MESTIVTDKSAPAGAGQADPGQGAAPAPAAINWTEHIPAEYKNEKLWESYKGKPLGDVLKSTAEAQKLTSPAEMGELFKVIGFAKATCWFFCFRVSCCKITDAFHPVQCFK